jgi:hypothetical protein
MNSVNFEFLALELNWTKIQRIDILVLFGWIFRVLSGSVGTMEEPIPWEDHFKSWLPVTVDRSEALFAAWYEFFPRSAEGKPNAGSKFRDRRKIDNVEPHRFCIIDSPEATHRCLIQVCARYFSPLKVSGNLIIVLLKDVC